MNIIINLFIRSLAVFIAAYLLPGVKLDSFFTAIVVAIVLGIVNTIIKPIIIILTLPFNILTLGLFTFIINGLMIILTASIVSGFHVNSIWQAIVFSIVLFFVNWFLDKISK